MITKYQTKDASSNMTKKNLTSSTKSMSTPPTKQRQVVNKISVQSTSDTTSIKSKSPSNHCHSSGRISSEFQQLKSNIDSLVTRIGSSEQTVSSQKVLIHQQGHCIFTGIC